MTINYLDSKRISVLSSKTSSQLLGDDSRTLNHTTQRIKLSMRFNAGHVLEDQPIIKVTWNLSRSSTSPTGNVTAHIRTSSGVEREQSTTLLDATTLTTSYVDKEFVFTGNTVLDDTDMITCEFSSTSNANNVNMRAVLGSTLAPPANTEMWNYSTGGGWSRVAQNGGYYDTLKFKVDYGDVKPTNVQDNSILVEKDTGKRYWFDAIDVNSVSDSGISKANCKLYYKLDEASGSAINTATTGNGFTDGLGSSANGTQGSTGATQNVTGIIDKCISISGTNQEINCNNTVLSGTTDFTMSAWINPTTMGSHASTIFNSYSSSYGGGIQFYITTSTKLEVWSAGGDFLSSSTIAIDDTWKHVAVTREGTSTKIYINGVLDATATVSHSISGDNMTIGGYVDGTNPFLGKIDDVSIWTRALSASEITTLYGQPTATWTYEYALPTISGLKLHLDSSDSTTITKDGSNLVSAWNDKSGQLNHVTQATATNQPLWVNSVLNSLPVVRFDGVDNFIKRTTWLAGALTTSTIFIVCTDSVTTSDTYFDSGTNRTMFSVDDAGYDIYAGTFLTGTTSTSAGAWSYMELVFNGASSIIRKNGTTLITGNAGSQSNNGIVLGANFVGNQPIVTDIAEFLVYEGTLSDTDRDSIESYLATKWGL